jgi:hypothetical protein
MQKKWMLALLSALLLQATVASADEFPKGCSSKDILYSGDEVVLASVPTKETYRVFVFGNATDRPIQVNHILPETNPKWQIWDSEINEDQWSALLLGQTNFSMTCQQKEGEAWDKVPCKDVVKVCELAVSEVMQSSRGNYWITENQPNQAQLFGWIRFQGIYP